MKNQNLLLLCLLTLALSPARGAEEVQPGMLRLPDMPLHDPYILTHQPSQTYYLYTSNRGHLTGTPGVGTMVYKSKDLLNWEKPKAVFIVPENSYAQHGGWAPEVHEYKGRFYLFVTLHNEEQIIERPPESWKTTHVRGTITAVSDSPDGPFTMLNPDAAVPPADFMTLDGTLVGDEKEQPWMVYAHEWLQKADGTIEAIRLSDDLSHAVGEPIHLFKASDAPWLNASITPDTGVLHYVTDGPQLFRSKDGHLLMLWSSYENSSYVQTIARSESGRLEGPWVQLNPLVKGDSGHGMLFRTFDGKLMMVLHRPFRNARGKLYEMADCGDHLEVIRERIDLDGDPREIFEMRGSASDLEPAMSFPGQVPESEMSAYLMVYFSDSDHSLHMALSSDGYSFTALNDNKPVVEGKQVALQMGIRDPHITRGPNGMFYLAMTDLHIFAQREGLRDTEWERDGEKYDWGNNRGFVLGTSEDLINWKFTNLRVDLAFPGFEEVGCAWAPQSIYDEKAGKMMLYFTIRFQKGRNQMVYAYMNDAFTEMTTYPQLLFLYPRDVNAIDADIIKVGNKFHLFYDPHDGGAGIKHAESDSVNFGYVYEPDWVDPEPQACEAPNAWKRIGEEKWVLMYDVYGIDPHNFGFSETTDFKTYTNLGRFNEGVMKSTNFTSPKHGAVIQLTQEEVDRLARHWELVTY